NVRRCAGCQAEVRLLSPVVDALAYTVPQIEPPVGLKSRVLNSIVAPAYDVRLNADAPARGRSVPWLAAAAAIVLAIGLAGYAVQLRGQIGSLETRLRQALARVDATERQIADARLAVAAAESRVAVLPAPDLARIDLAGRPAAPQASARAFWRRSRGL